MYAARTCSCETAGQSKRARIDCFARTYQAFLQARGRGHQFDANAFARYQHMHEIRCDAIAFDGVTEQLAETLIAQQFVKNYSETHPRFVYDIPPLNFKTKVDFFNTL